MNCTACVQTCPEKETTYRAGVTKVSVIVELQDINIQGQQTPLMLDLGYKHEEHGGTPTMLTNRVKKEREGEKIEHEWERDKGSRVKIERKIEREPKKANEKIN